MKNKILISLILLNILGINAFADVQQPVAQPVTQAVVPVQNYTSANNCFKYFAISSEKLYFLTLAAIAENKYFTSETQTKEGYILFSASNKDFLATVADIDTKTSVLKIAPTDNRYSFNPAIVNKIFEYITQNIGTEPTIYVKGK